jgi:hypothetical protein
VFCVCVGIIGLTGESLVCVGMIGVSRSAVSNWQFAVFSDRRIGPGKETEGKKKRRVASKEKNKEEGKEGLNAETQRTLRFAEEDRRRTGRSGEQREKQRPTQRRDTENAEIRGGSGRVQMRVARNREKRRKQPGARSRESRQTNE